MRYRVCYRFSEEGRWYIFKDCNEDELGSTVEEAFLISDVLYEVKIYRIRKDG